MKCFAVLVFAALFALISPAAAIDEECKACRAIAVSRQRAPRRTILIRRVFRRPGCFFMLLRTRFFYAFVAFRLSFEGEGLLVSKGVLFRLSLGRCMLLTMAGACVFYREASASFTRPWIVTSHPVPRDVASRSFHTTWYSSITLLSRTRADVVRSSTPPPCSKLSSSFLCLVPCVVFYRMNESENKTQKEVATKIIKDSPWKRHRKRKDDDPLIMTEYETVSTLETSCNKMKGYNLKDNDWVRVSEEGKMPVSFSFGGENPDLGSINFEKSIGQQRGVREYDDKMISSYCLRIMEHRDEELTDLIQSKTLTTQNVQQNVINAMCSWEKKKKSPCKTEDELMGRFPAKAKEEEEKETKKTTPEVEGETAEKKEKKKEEEEEEPKKKEEKKSKKKSKKSNKKSEL